MKTILFTDLGSDEQRILRATVERSGRSLNKVTNPQVAATVCTATNQYVGNNVFLSNCTLYCAEVSAILAAVAHNDTAIERIYLAVRRADGSEPGLITPCGNCRQVIADFSILSKSNIQLYSTNDKLEEVLVFDSVEILPEAFKSVSLMQLGRGGEV